MKRAVRLALIALILVAAVIGWGAWAVSSTAPPAIAAGWDWAVARATGSDPRTRCWRQEADDGGAIPTAAFIGERACYRFEAPRRFRGIFVAEFEGDIFLEGAGTAGPYRVLPEQTWLSTDEQTVFEDGTEPMFRNHDGMTRIIAIDFVGRPAVGRGGFGHAGMSDHLVLVDRVLGARVLHTVRGYAGPDLLIR